MSATDRARKAAQQHDAALNNRVLEGMREALASPNGRALVWFFYASHIDTEGPGSRGRRFVARDLMRLAVVADHAGVQTMRAEYEPMSVVRKQAEKSEAEEEINEE